MNKITNVVIRDIYTDTPASYSTKDRLEEVAEEVDTSKYNILGFLNRTNQIVLEPRFHNVRNRRGQFA